MPERNMSGKTADRQVMIAKIAGSAAAFGLLVMWMTPPTTPHPLAPSPLEAFRKIHSDAPTLDVATEEIAPSAYVPSAMMPPGMPWAQPRPAQPVEARYEQAAPSAVATADDPAPDDAQYVEANQADPTPQIEPAQLRPTRSPASQPQSARSQPGAAALALRHSPSDAQSAYQQRHATWAQAMASDVAGVEDEEP